MHFVLLIRVITRSNRADAFDWKLPLRCQGMLHCGGNARWAVTGTGPGLEINY